MSTPATQSTISNVAFYGEEGSWSTAELLHSEPLVERSRAHAWRIAPHRHSSVVQVFWLAKGEGNARFDGNQHHLGAHCLAVIPENCVHEFSWRQDSDGFALSLATTLVRELRAQRGFGDDLMKSASVLGGTDSREFLNALFGSIQEEYVGQESLREAALDSLVRTLAVWIARHSPADPTRPDRASRGSIHFSRFLKLLDEHHKQQWGVADYARHLGVSPSHLNAVSHTHGGASAKHLIQHRLLLAARRQLTYTDKPITDIAQSIGFGDASYFTRFFRRGMQMTPKEYRRRSGTTKGLD